MAKGKVPSADLKNLAEIYNSEGTAAVKKILEDQYDVKQTCQVIRRMKMTGELEYDVESDRFFALGDAESENVFMSIDELCTTSLKEAASTAKIDAESQRNAMAKLVQDLIGERLLELSRYVTLSPFSKTVIVDRASLESSGYRLEIQ